MTGMHGFQRETGPAGARNHVFILPSVVCSALVAREIAEASGAVAVSHQHGCGHIGPDIGQTRRLFVGLATNPNVAHAVVVSLGCETVQGNVVADELNRLGHKTQLISIQGAGGNEAAREVGIHQARALTDAVADAQRTLVPAHDLVIGIAQSRLDDRVGDLVARALATGARVVLATDRSLPSEWPQEHDVIDIGDAPTAPLSLVRNPGSGAQLLAAAASCHAQVLVDFPAQDQPPLGFSLSPVVSVAAGAGLHALIADEFDLTAEADATAIWDRVGEVFSGAQSKTEARGSASFSIPRLIRTM